MGYKFTRAAAGRLIVSTLLCLAASPASGLVFRVGNTNDTYSFTSLRGAIMVANQFGGKNTILLGQAPIPRSRSLPHPWTFHLTLAGPDEDNGRTGDLDVTRGELTIIGATSNVVIDATGLGDRVFQVSKNAKLTLQNVTITGGAAPGNRYAYLGNGESGGAIFNAGTLLLDQCIITNNASGGGNFPMGNGGGTVGGDGGGICSSGTLTMTHCVVARNSSGSGADGASGGSGGGIKNDGICLLSDCIVAENLSGDSGDPSGNAIGLAGNGGNGGGIYNAGTLTLIQSTISDNWAGTGGIGGRVPGTTFPASFNSGTGGNGGGIYNAGKLSLTICTISGNTSGFGGNGRELTTGGTGGAGGGIYNLGSIIMNSCTLAGNASGSGGSGSAGYPGGPGGYPGGNGGDGGGFFNASSNSAAKIKNTLIAFNAPGAGGNGGAGSPAFSSLPGGPAGPVGTAGFGPDLTGDFTSQGFNLISIGDGSNGFTNGIHADQIGSDALPIDPRLGPLQMNGGPTPTHALLPGSSAIDQGNSFGLRTDQRGAKRPYNNPVIPNAAGGDGGDIGAYEMGK